MALSSSARDGCRVEHSDNCWNLFRCPGVRVYAKIDAFGKHMTGHCANQAFARIQTRIQFRIQTVDFEYVVMQHGDRAWRGAGTEITDFSNC